jgi:hypothetical protein
MLQTCQQSHNSFCAKSHVHAICVLRSTAEQCQESATMAELIDMPAHARAPRSSSAHAAKSASFRSV